MCCIVWKTKLLHHKELAANGKKAPETCSSSKTGFLVETEDRPGSTHHQQFSNQFESGRYISKLWNSNNNWVSAERASSSKDKTAAAQCSCGDMYVLTQYKLNREVLYQCVVLNCSAHKVLEIERSVRSEWQPWLVHGMELDAHIRRYLRCREREKKNHPSMAQAR